MLLAGPSGPDEMSLPDVNGLLYISWSVQLFNVTLYFLYTVQKSTLLGILKWYMPSLLTTCQKSSREGRADSPVFTSQL